MSIAKSLLQTLRPLARETGASLVEYAMAVALIAVVSISAITLVGENAAEEYDCIALELNEPDIRVKVLEKLRNDVHGFTVVEEKYAAGCV